MQIEKMIADELQCMFLEGELIGIQEQYLNLITRKLRTGKLTLFQLIEQNAIAQDKLLEAQARINSNRIV
jgi:uncharacterized membrane protein